MSKTDPSVVSPVPASPEPVIPADEKLAYENRVGLDGRGELVVTIVEAIASIRDVAVTELVPTIQEAVDPDGLERIFRPHPNAPDRLGWVTFFFHGCRVVLFSDGTLRIYERPVAPAGT